VLYDDTIRQIYDLEPQAQALGNLGNSVTVEGALDDGTIHVSSLKLLTSIGLPVGKKAPPRPVSFSVHGAIAEHYKVDPAKLKETHAATIEYVIAATAG
jgi:hypothetical protein